MSVRTQVRVPKYRLHKPTGVALVRLTVKRLGLPASPRRGLGTTNVIESPDGTVRQKIGRVKRWRDGAMVLRWAASAFLASEKSFRRLMGCRSRCAGRCSKRV